MNRHAESSALVEPEPTVPSQQRARALAIVDYGNVVSREAEADSSLIRHLMMELVNAVVELAPVTAHLSVRAYGGWLTDGVVTTSASKAMRALAGADLFPMRHPIKEQAVLHGSIDLARSLLGVPHVEFPDTFRVRRSPPRLRLAQGSIPAKCAADSSECPAVILKRFTGSARKTCPVDDCSVVCNEAFETSEQKMVDTLIACDLIEAARTEAFGLVALVSCDTDLFPPIVYASSFSSTPMAVITPDRCWQSYYADYFRQTGVHLIPGESTHVVA